MNEQLYAVNIAEYASACAGYPCGVLLFSKRVIVMLVASRDAASQFGVHSVAGWACVVALILLVVAGLWFLVPGVQRFFYQKLPDGADGSGLGSVVGGGAARGWESWRPWAGKKEKVDDDMQDGPGKDSGMFGRDAWRRMWSGFNGSGAAAGSAEATNKLSSSRDYV